MIQGTYSFGLMGSGGATDLGSAMTGYYAASQIDSNNMSRYSNPDVDALLAALFLELLALVDEDAPYLPIATAIFIYCWNADLNFKPASDVNLYCEAGWKY